ncbi:MAG: hypothetical protein NEHIOOID_00453 [Holosporales bacterium]
MIRFFAFAYWGLCALAATELTKETFDERIQSPFPENERASLKKEIDKLTPEHYNQKFISVFHALAENVEPLNRRHIIILLKNFGKTICHERFIETVQLLSEGLPTLDKVNVIRTVARIPQDQYKDFIDSIICLSFQLNEEDLRYLFRVFCDVQPCNIPFLIQFIKHDRVFFDHVSCKDLSASISMVHSLDDIKDILKGLYAQYQRVKSSKKIHPDGLAFEIHNYADMVLGEENDLPLFKLVLFALNTKIDKRYSIEESKKILEHNYILIQKSLKEKMEKRKNLKWVLSCQNTRSDETILATVVSYLIQKDPTYNVLRNWISVLVEESKESYSGGNKESCIKGVKERVVTSLKSALLDDPVFCDYFSKAEHYFMQTTKVKKLSDYAYWATRLMEHGVNENTPMEEAKDRFSALLSDFLDPQKDQDVIASTLDNFNDTDETTHDGLWSKIKENFKK